MSNNSVYKLTATLSVLETDHVSSILHDYKCKMLAKKLDAMVNNDELQIEWIDEHLYWHESVMRKLNWVKLEN